MVGLVGVVVAFASLAMLFATGTVFPWLFAWLVGVTMLIADDSLGRK